MFSSDFPILEKSISWKKLIYFDAACTALKPYQTIDGISRYYREYSCCSWDRESSFLGSKLQEEIHQTRKEIQKFLWAHDDDSIIFTGSATDGINMLMHAIGWNIHTFIVSNLEHNSIYLPAYEVAKKQNKDFLVTPYWEILKREHLEKHLASIQKPFLLSVTHASNIIGGRFDIREVAECVHKYGGYILVDDTQFVSYNDEEMQKNNIDFLVFSWHKIGGPTGIWVLAIKKTASFLIQESSRIGWGTIRSISDVPVYKWLPYFLEWGVQNFWGILGLLWALSWRNTVTTDILHQHVLSLSQYFIDKLHREKLADILQVISLPESSLISVIPETFQAIDFHQYCNYFLPEAIIAFRTGTMCADIFSQTSLNSEKNIMRFSFGIYNTKEEIDILFIALKTYLWSLKK